MVKVSVIGVGNLGSCIAYEIAIRGITDELILVDVLRDLAEGQAIDIEQAIAMRNDTRVIAGNYEDVEGSDLVIVSAGRARTPEMKSRLELLNINSRIIKDVASSLKPFLSKECIVITLTNPLDIMNFLLWKFLGIGRCKVIGSSSQLDSARFRSLLAKKFHVKPSEIDAFVIGEHGEHQVPLFSRVKVSGKSVSLEQIEKKTIHEALREYALRT
ncbi:malate dehydrogenase, partial [Candidatus Bathyarchaeota archaeon]|nr:malate dehydrogenase [Candidatus Bathyarchaeota archaeon]